MLLGSIPEKRSSQLAIEANISLPLIRETKAHVAIYTDRSATGGTTKEGSAMEATVGDPADPVIICTSKVRGADLAPSYEEEKATLLLALDRAWANRALNAYQYALTAKFILKLSIMALMTRSICIP